jgi:hypothetical protein
MNFVCHFQQSDSVRERSGFVRTSSPFKTMREKLAPKNPVFLEKNAIFKIPISKNRENKRKTTMVVLEKGKIKSENTTVS